MGHLKDIAYGPENKATFKYNNRKVNLNMCFGVPKNVIFKKVDKDVFQ